MRRSFFLIVGIACLAETSADWPRPHYDTPNTSHIVVDSDGSLSFRPHPFPSTWPLVPVDESGERLLSPPPHPWVFENTKRRGLSDRVRPLSNRAVELSPQLICLSGDSEDLTVKRQILLHRIESDALTETCKITVHNGKKETAQIRVIETLRWLNKEVLKRADGISNESRISPIHSSWEILESTDIYKKWKDGTIEYLVQLKPDQEKEIAYTVKYSK